MRLPGDSVAEVVDHAAIAADGRFVVQAGYVIRAAQGPTTYDELVPRDGALEDEHREPFIQSIDLEAKRAGWRVHGHARGTWTVAILPNAQRLVSGGVDGRQRGELTLSDLKTGACLRTYPDADRRWIAQLAPLPDGKRFLSACAWDNDVKLWALDRAQPLRVFSGHQVDPKNSVLAVAASTDGSVAVSGALDGSIKLWNVETGECVRTFSGSSGEVRAVAMASRADRIVSGTTAGDVDVWELGTGRIVRTLRGHAGPVRHVAVTSDGRWIVSGGQDPTVNIWDARSGTLHASIARGLRSCDAIALSMDERCVYVASAARVDKILIANGSQRVVWDPEPPISEAFEQ